MQPRRAIEVRDWGLGARDQGLEQFRIHPPIHSSTYPPIHPYLKKLLHFGIPELTCMRDMHYLYKEVARREFDSVLGSLVVFAGLVGVRGRNEQFTRIIQTLHS
ncbi:hypothetical protein [Leptothermofonsia sp. ETS-13]|uniref:hypothetical protein n=1 Tax=Leptothermofonsia sp. ETS-13 TaxID=3035696 RepID=UPI003B9DDB99